MVISILEAKDNKDQANIQQISTHSTSWVEEYDFMLGDLLIILGLC
jgi:hypothetical protein